jgi:hypothetical protein
MKNPFGRSPRWAGSMLGSLTVASLLVALAGAAPATALPGCSVPDPPPACDPPEPTPSGSPTGTFSGVTRIPTGIKVTGTAKDPDATGEVTVQISVNGSYRGSVNTIGGAFTGTVPAVAGRASVCVVAVNRNRGESTDLGCKVLTVAVNPFGHVDAVSVGPSGIRVQGWAIDPDTTRPITLQVYADERLVGSGTASVGRTDVGSAYPLYGASHGFDLTVPWQAHGRICVTAGNVGLGASTSVGCARDKDAVSVLTLNLFGAATTFPDDSGTGSVEIAWRARYDRIAAWMQSNGTLPDILNLQDVTLRRVVALPLAHLDPPDYEVLFELIARIKARTGTQYRIAFAASGAPVQTGINWLESGHAVLYNATRLRNTTMTGTAGRTPMPDSDNTVTSVHLRTSFPCRDTSATYAGWCSLIDGQGVYFTSPYRNNAGKWDLGPQAVLFELVGDPGKHVLVADVHAHPSEDPGSSFKAITDLVTVARAAWGSVPLLYPPIVAGDFNASPADMAIETTTGAFAKFQIAGAVDVDNVLVGRGSAFPSTRVPAFKSQALPGIDPSTGLCHPSTATLWSDHCAVLTQIVPRS